MQLFKSAHLNLAYAFAADTEFRRKVFEGERRFCQPPGLKDPLFALIQILHRSHHQRFAGGKFLMLGKGGLLVLAIILKPVLPFAAAFAIAGQRDIQRPVITSHALVHRNHLGFGYIQLCGDFGDLFGAQITIIDCLDLTLDAAQVEKQLFLSGGGADLYQRP